MNKLRFVFLLLLVATLGCSFLLYPDVTPPAPSQSPRPTSPFAESGFHWIIQSQPRQQTENARQIPDFNDTWEVPAKWDNYEFRASQSPTGYGAVNLRVEIKLFGETEVGEGNCTVAEISFDGVSTKPDEFLSIETIFPTYMEGEGWDSYDMTFYLYCDPLLEQWYFVLAE